MMFKRFAIWSGASIGRLGSRPGAHRSLVFDQFGRRGGRHYADPPPGLAVGRPGSGCDRGGDRGGRAVAHGLHQHHQRAPAEEHGRRRHLRQGRELARHRVALSGHGSSRSQRGLCGGFQDDRRGSHLERVAARARLHHGHRSEESERALYGRHRRGEEQRRGRDLGSLLRRSGRGADLVSVDRSLPSGRALHRHQRRRRFPVHRRRV